MTQLEHTKTYTQKQYVDLGLPHILEEIRRAINQKSRRVHWSTAKELIEKTSIGVNYKGEKIKIEPTVCVKITVEAE